MGDVAESLELLNVLLICSPLYTHLNFIKQHRTQK